MKRLGLNRGGYLGERIDVLEVLEDDLEAGVRFGWQREKLSAGVGLELLALQRSFGNPRENIYISTGIHGDEPAGPLAIRQLLQDNAWPENTGVWICPCLNPTGFQSNTRENAKGADLNRDYRHLQSDEISAHVAWLQEQPNFDLTLCVHEDWEAQGFYLYELNPDLQPSHAERIIREVEKICPIDRSPMIEGRPAKDGIIRPDLDPSKRPQWPEAFFLIRHKTRHSYTLEGPSDFSLPVRVAALVTAIRTVLHGR
ncbi:MAG: M14 family metallocarboxypeptidase [Verrucomicrobia bacterium]|nr:M14 family metallocarboxypeptidase [Verrucomicrobiota bacterium]